MLGDPPGTDERERMYGAAYYGCWGDSEEEWFGMVRRLKQETFARIFRRVAPWRPPGRILDVGCALGASLEVARRFGWDPDGLEINPYAVTMVRERLGWELHQGDFESVDLPDGAYDAILMVDVFEHLSAPVPAMTKARRLLRPDGLVILSVPCASSVTAKLLGPYWPHLQREHLFYPSWRSLRVLCEKTGFEVLLVRPTVKVLNLRYIARSLDRRPIPLFSEISRRLGRVAPDWISRWGFPIRSGEILVIARKGPARA
ncbi:MAG: class I SAM-dependent methyltransferase [Candidatus Omnitrophica bacterium]|nr:class I SAM-dependent methyltransferase [Candidatus Omnitrophota bacterium]